MDSRYYARRLEERLPEVIQGGPNMSALFEALGQEMSRMADGAKLLMRSRWHVLAQGWIDSTVDIVKKKDTELGRISALFGLKPEQGESDLQFRRRLLEFVHIHRIGLGSAPALIRLAALVYRAEGSPEIEWSGQTLITRITVTDRTGSKRILRLELIDNPSKAAEIVFKDVTAGSKLLVINQGLDAAMPMIELTATKSAVAVPMLEHIETGMCILYVGRVPQGIQLCLRNGKPPLLNGFLRNEAPLEYSRFNKSRFYTETDPEKARFSDIDLETADIMLVGHGFRYDECQFHTPTDPKSVQFASFSSDRDFPLLSPGESSWSYRILNRPNLKSYLVDRDDAKSLLQYALDEGNAPPVDLKFSWEERVPACFTLRIPGDYVPPFMKNLGELEHALNRAMNYGRAAGVRARLEVLMPFREQLLEITDRVKIHTQTKFRANHDIRDKMAPPLIQMELKDWVEVSDRFGTLGVYENAHWDYATFVEASKLDDRGCYDKGQFNRVKFV